MGDQTSEAMNLDLNLGPVPEHESGSSPEPPVNLDEWIDDPFGRIREAVRFGSRWRSRQVRIRHNISGIRQAPVAEREQRNVSLEFAQILANSPNGRALLAGEGSVAAEERVEEVPKTCENSNGFLEEEASDKDEDEKGIGSDGGFFDCNICLDLAREPVVTCCGHLFCWPCLYRWLHYHSDAKECPVCKGEVTVKNVTPIYGRGKGPRQVEEDPTLKIPSRPTARRVESWRQTIQRSGFSFPMEEMLRRLSSRFEFTRDLVSEHHTEDARELAQRTTSLVNRILTSRGLRREHVPGQPPSEGVVDLTQGETSTDTGETRRPQPSLLRRSHSIRAAELERLGDPHIRSHATGRNQEQPLPVDDRDSFSSIAAVINSEGQTIDTAVEIDSMVSLSTSSSRIRNEATRIADMDSGDSRAPRRRRLN